MFEKVVYIDEHSVRSVHSCYRQHWRKKKMFVLLRNGLLVVVAADVGWTVHWRMVGVVGGCCCDYDYLKAMKEVVESCNYVIGSGEMCGVGWIACLEYHVGRRK